MSENVNLMLASVQKDSLYSSSQISSSMMIWLAKLNRATRKRINTRQWSSWRIASSTSQRRKNSSRATNGTALIAENTNWQRRSLKFIRLRRYWSCIWKDSRTRECSKRKRMKQRSFFPKIWIWVPILSTEPPLPPITSKQSKRKY